MPELAAAPIFSRRQRRSHHFQPQAASSMLYVGIPNSPHKASSTHLIPSALEVAVGNIFNPRQLPNITNQCKTSPHKNQCQIEMHAWACVVAAAAKTAAEKDWLQESKTHAEQTSNYKNRKGALWTCTNKNSINIHAETKTHTHTHTHTQTHTRTHTGTNTHTHKHRHARTHTCTHAHMHTRKNLHMHASPHPADTHTHIYIYIYIYIYTHIHANNYRRSCADQHKERQRDWNWQQNTWTLNHRHTDRDINEDDTSKEDNAEIRNAKQSDCADPDSSVCGRGAALKFHIVYVNDCILPRRRNTFNNKLRTLSSDMELKWPLLLSSSFKFGDWSSYYYLFFICGQHQWKVSKSIC